MGGSLMDILGFWKKIEIRVGHFTLTKFLLRYFW